MIAAVEDAPAHIECVCGAALARVSRYGAAHGLYPVKDVRAAFEGGRVILTCPHCGKRRKLDITARAA